MDSQKPLISQRIEGIRTPRVADERTLRLCFSEQDAIVASIQLSGLTYREIAARMGKGKSLVDAMAKGTRQLTRKNTQAFMHATGTRLIEQYREMQRAMDMASGVVRERDRMAAIVAPTQQTWASYGRAAA
jgi:succinate dehydrogenase/fumarate reductase flavoprotein subunit